MMKPGRVKLAFTYNKPYIVSVINGLIRDNVTFTAGSYYINVRSMYGLIPRVVLHSRNRTLEITVRMSTIRDNWYFFENLFGWKKEILSSTTSVTLNDEEKDKFTRLFDFVFKNMPDLEIFMH